MLISTRNPWREILLLMCGDEWPQRYVRKLNQPVWAERRFLYVCNLQAWDICGYVDLEVSRLKID